MFDIQVKNSIIEHCEQQIDKYNFGQRSTANGNKEQQLTGIIGQSVVMELFQLGHINGNDGFDNGIDIVYTNIFGSISLDVKTMGRTTSVKPNYTNNFIALQDYFNPEGYIFCSYNKSNKVLTICGWVTKQEFINKRKYYPKGTIRERSNGTTFETKADLYEIDIIDLNDVIDELDLKKQLTLII
jgi:hypothetical protein